MEPEGEEQDVVGDDQPVEGGSQATNGNAWYPSPWDGVITNFDLAVDFNYAGRTNGLGYEFFIGETNGVNGGLPLFVSPAVGDFRLQSTNSVLWEAGAATAFNVDMAGFLRASDIGPLELQAESESTPAFPVKMIFSGRVRLEGRLGSY